MRFKNIERKPKKESPKKTISASGGRFKSLERKPEKESPKKISASGGLGLLSSTYKSTYRYELLNNEYKDKKYKQQL